VARRTQKVTLADILGDDAVTVAVPEQKNEARPVPSRPVGDRRKRNQSNGMVGMMVRITLALGALGIFAFPTFLIVILGMTPTLVGLFASQRPDRTKIQTVAAFNMSGVILFLVPLWMDGHTMDNAIHVLSNVYSWAVMYSAAAMGFAVLWLGPQIAALILNALAIGRRGKLDSIRSELIEEWGTGILPDDALLPHGVASRAKKGAAGKSKSERPDAA